MSVPAMTVEQGLAGMCFDSWKLGYTRHGRQLFVHYPKASSTVPGTLEYGVGVPFDPEPEIHLSPDGERARLWQEMLK